MPLKEAFTRVKNLSKKKILAKAPEFIKGLKTCLIRGDRLLPIAKALSGEHEKPIICLTCMEISNYKYFVRIHDDLLIHLLLIAQFNLDGIDGLETEIRKMTRMKEEYSEKLEAFIRQ